MINEGDEDDISQLTCERLQLAQHEQPHVGLIATMELGFVANRTETVADDRDEHAQTDEHHHEDEQAETERTEEGRGADQLARVELQQRHLEQHLRGVQQIGARCERRREQQVEQREKGHEHD